MHLREMMEENQNGNPKPEAKRRFIIIKYLGVKPSF